MTQVDTKQKILDVAATLFAEKGYEGASVRDIAAAAEVNIAAVNYHFQTKQNLFWQVNLDAHVWMEDRMAQAAKDCQTVHCFTHRMVDCFMEHAQHLKHVFAIMLSDTHPPMEEEMLEELRCKKELGPPGGEHLIKILQNELGNQVSPDAVQWAMKQIFTYVIHWVLLLGSSYCQEIHAEQEDFTEASFRRSLDFHLEATMNYLKEHPEKFG